MSSEAWLKLDAGLAPAILSPGGDGLGGFCSQLAAGRAPPPGDLAAKVGLVDALVALHEASGPQIVQHHGHLAVAHAEGLGEGLYAKLLGVRAR